jgi:acetoin utilization protein AcuB
MKNQSPGKSEDGKAAGCKWMVKERMNPSPITVTSDDSLHDALEMLHRYNIRELPVVEHGNLIGIVTDRDLRQVAPSYPLFRDQEEIKYFSRNLKVATAMTPDPMVVAPDSSLVEAATKLDTYRIGSLPVVDKEKLVGIISVSDILKAFIEQNTA